MKKVFYLLFISLLFVACSSDDDDTSSRLPIENLALPESSANAPLSNTEVITINGKGFNNSDEFWFTSTAKSTSTSTSGKGEVKEVTDSYVKILPPKVFGLQAVTMKRGMDVYNLGNIYFDSKSLSKRMTKYMHSSDNDHDYYAFEYNSNGLVSKITDGDDDGIQSTYNLVYENNKLVRINVEEDDDEPYFFNISYTGNMVKISYSGLPWNINKQGTDTIILNESGNPEKIKYQGGYTTDFTYNEKGNIARTSSYNNGIDYREDYTLSYDDKKSFISNMNLPAWFWVYNEFDIELGCGLVNNILKVNNRDTYSYTYNSEGYPLTIRDLLDEDELEITISYEDF